MIEVDRAALYLNRSTGFEYPVPCGSDGAIVSDLWVSRRDRNYTTINFFTWTLLEYDGILYFDVSVCVLENPVPFITSACNSGRPFAADVVTE